MRDTQCLIDSNILLRWVQPKHPDNPIVEAALDRLTRRNVVLCYASQNLGEFWNVCTRPVERNGYALSPQETAYRAQLFEESLLLLHESPLVHMEWRRLLVERGVSGVQVHDARLVAVMNANAINQILTFNIKDFRRYPHIGASAPMDILALA